MLNTKSRYYVWQRSDGHVGCTTFAPPNFPNHTFKVLKEFDDWSLDVVALIKKTRADAKLLASQSPA